jgi:hypothetical protein
MAADNQFLSQLIPWFENLNTTQIHTKKLGNMNLTFLRPFSKEFAKSYYYLSRVRLSVSVEAIYWVDFFFKFCVGNF